MRQKQCAGRGLGLAELITQTPRRCVVRPRPDRDRAGAVGVGALKPAQMFDCHRLALLFGIPKRTLALREQQQDSGQLCMGVRAEELNIRETREFN
jgi:hypothetical protein